VAEEAIVPSQRLLKMLDPTGHLVPERTLASQAPKAVVWAPTASLSVHIRDELAAAGVEALQATAFRHVATSLRASARPAIALAVVELPALGDPELSMLVTARWAGYTGSLLGVGRAADVPPKMRLMLGLEIVEPSEGAIRDRAHAIRHRPR
jgi:hypothetical protein